MSIFAIAFLIMLVLKLTGWAMLDWWQVLLPLWAELAIDAVLLLWMTSMWKRTTGAEPVQRRVQDRAFRHWL